MYDQLATWAYIDLAATVMYFEIFGLNFIMKHM